MEVWMCFWWDRWQRRDSVTSPSRLFYTRILWVFFLISSFIKYLLSFWSPTWDGEKWSQRQLIGCVIYFLSAVDLIRRCSKLCRCDEDEVSPQSVNPSFTVCFCCSSSGDIVVLMVLILRWDIQSLLSVSPNVIFVFRFYRFIRSRTEGLRSEEVNSFRYSYCRQGHLHFILFTAAACWLVSLYRHKFCIQTLLNSQNFSLNASGDPKVYNDTKSVRSNFSDV